MSPAVCPLLPLWGEFLPFSLTLGCFGQKTGGLRHLLNQFGHPKWTVTFSAPCCSISKIMAFSTKKKCPRFCAFHSHNLLLEEHSHTSVVYFPIRTPAVIYRRVLGPPITGKNVEVLVFSSCTSRINLKCWEYSPKYNIWGHKYHVTDITKSHQVKLYFGLVFRSKEILLF